MAISLGLEKFNKPVAPQISMEALLLQTLSAPKFDTKKMDAQLAAFNTLNSILKVVKTGGIDTSIVKLYGKDLRSISPTFASKTEIVEEGTDEETVVMPEEATPEETKEIVEEVQTYITSTEGMLTDSFKSLFLRFRDSMKANLTRNSVLIRQAKEAASVAKISKEIGDGQYTGFTKEEFSAYLNSMTAHYKKVSASVKSGNMASNKAIGEVTTSALDLADIYVKADRELRDFKASGYTPKQLLDEVVGIEKALADVQSAGNDLDHAYKNLDVIHSDHGTSGITVQDSAMYQACSIIYNSLIDIENVLERHLVVIINISKSCK